MDPGHRRQGGTGGSYQTKPRNDRAARARPSALERAYARLGEDEVKRLQQTYEALDSKWNGTEHDQAEGMVLSLLRQGVPDAQIRAIFRVGGSMIARLKQVIKDGVDTLHTWRVRNPPAHALSADDIEFLCATCREWNLEEGFPCSHRGPRQYLAEAGITLKDLWQQYKQKAEAVPRRVILYTQYVHFKFPGFRLSRSQQDVCDACTKIEIALKNNALDDRARGELEAEKIMHQEAAINQRRAMTAFVKEYAAAFSPQQCLPEEIVPDHMEVPPHGMTEDQTTMPKMLIQIEDFGGSIALPVFGNRRPSADYFNSNLMLHNFVIADISSGDNTVFVYDERGQGKGADALCNLRLLHHLRLLNQVGSDGEGPQVLLQILDNCVGQNKSRVVFMFHAMLSLVFYKKVVLLFLLPGHSHNAADRVVSWCKQKLKGVNLYSPENVVTKMNETASVNAEFLDHRKEERPFYCGWELLLAKYYRRMPDGYTANYFFEIDRGNVTMRHLVTTSEQEAVQFSLIANGDPLAIRDAFLVDLLGNEYDLAMATMKDIRLQHQPLLPMTMKKTKSLALKYFSIPSEYLSYYPAAPEESRSESKRLESDAKKQKTSRCRCKSTTTEEKAWSSTEH
jgi:hypothetical protein